MNMEATDHDIHTYHEACRHLRGPRATLWGAGEFMIGAYQFDRVRIIMGLCLMILGTRKQRQS